jgi:ABC-type hemin transport system substrate-binding protein
MLACLQALLSCGRQAASGTSQSQPSGELRIVSLSPAISRTLIDFDLQSRIVGRTPHCASIDQSTPVVGDLFNVDYEQLVRLRPTHILVQPPASGIDQRLIELAQQRGWVLGQWRLNGREDIEDMVRELPGVLFADGDDQQAQAMRTSADVLNRIAQSLTPAGDSTFRGRVLIVNAVDPVMAFGSGTYLDDLLRSIGGENAVSASGWATLSLEDVVRINPQAVIIVREASLAPADAAPSEAAGPLARLDIEAARSGRIAVLDHPDALTPSSGLVGVAADLRAILHSFSESAP